MTYRFSRRSAKYVWLTLPGLFSIGLTVLWIVTIAPETQRATRIETEWRRDRLTQKQRADFLQEHQIHNDYSQLIFDGTTADQPDLKQQLLSWSDGDMTQSYAPGQIIRLLDMHHVCIGYLIAGAGMYLELDNPGLCMTANADVAPRLKTANTL